MNKKGIIITIILVSILMILSSIITAYATSYLYNSSEVSYDNTTSKITSDNVQGAIDELYTQATNYNDLNTRVSTLESKVAKVGSVSETFSFSGGEHRNDSINYTDNIKQLLSVWIESEQGSWVQVQLMNIDSSNKYFRLGFYNGYTGSLSIKVTVHYLYL